MEIARELKDTSNALREFVASVLDRNLGVDWLIECGLPEERIEAWRRKKAGAEAQVMPMAGAEHPIFFAPLEDIAELLKIHWDTEFYAVFGDLETTVVFIRTLEKYLDPDMARRELFIFQKHLVLGVSGELRARIIAYRSMLEVGKEGFPRIESVKDSFGNLWTVGKPMRIKTNSTLRVGDVVEYIITASDPEQEPLQYRILGYKWESSNILRLVIDEKMVGKDGKVNLTIRSNRKFHAYPLGYDDRVVFEYQILPRELSFAKKT
ncbi:MAG: hypothetical protein EA392_09165 [Cryomorphaceae bacterium]|nr:MAG: hypothetical protein EA392_09165 [Cryomorphaceae bacterium]